MTQSIKYSAERLLSLILFLSLILLITRGWAAAPVYVVGTVFDDDTGEPIPWVNVHTRSGKSLGQSNSRGRFELEVESRQAILIFKRHGFLDHEADLSDYPELIDIEIGLKTTARELKTLQVQSDKIKKGDNFKKQTVDELEQYSGMRIDLNDHLQNMNGVQIPTESSSDISVYGGRTQDASHYLGQLRIPNMRHLDFGFPGNQSVINPRLLRSVSVQDNLAEGPLNQGNSSAIQYELKQGDPERITGDLVFGTINRELNLSSYWDRRTWLFSIRTLQPTFLANLGKHYYTIPKVSRLGRGCADGIPCDYLKDPINTSTIDLFLGTFETDTIGGFSRAFFLLSGDDFEVEEDISSDPNSTVAQVVEKGEQINGLLSYERVIPGESGELQYALGGFSGVSSRLNKDTSATDDINLWPWYSAASQSKMGQTDIRELKALTNVQWDPDSPLWGANYSYGLELNYLNETREFSDKTSNQNYNTDQSMLEGTGLLRLKWEHDKSLWTSSAGINYFTGGLPLPVLQGRYTRSIFDSFSGYGDISLRQSTSFEPVDINEVAAYTTTSMEAKTGVTGSTPGNINFTCDLYTRYYHKPLLPEPDVYWNYKELRSADYAMVFGTNLSATWQPWHHFAMSVNGSVVQGDYYLSDGGALPWEANRTLSLVSNLRIVPRRDSLLSIIITYNVNNDQPIYEYELPQHPIGGVNSRNDKETRYIKQSVEYPTVSRQRLDARLNLDLSSTWRPLDKARLFFQVSNIFADYDGSFLGWLGGNNAKQRGWTRISPNSNNSGDLTPIVIQGLGLFILFGFEMNFSI